MSSSASVAELLPGGRAARVDVPVHQPVRVEVLLLVLPERVERRLVVHVDGEHHPVRDPFRDGVVAVAGPGDAHRTVGAVGDDQRRLVRGPAHHHVVVAAGRRVDAGARRAVLREREVGAARRRAGRPGVAGRAPRRCRRCRRSRRRCRRWCHRCRRVPRRCRRCPRAAAPLPAVAPPAAGAARAGAAAAAASRARPPPVPRCRRRRRAAGRGAAAAGRARAAAAGVPPRPAVPVVPAGPLPPSGRAGATGRCGLPLSDGVQPGASDSSRSGAIRRRSEEGREASMTSGPGAASQHVNLR